MTEFQQFADKPSMGQSVGGFAIHILTASGAALAFLALLAAVDRAWSAMFLWLGIALIVDGLDGPLARGFNIAAVLPRWSGDTLDLVVDFVTYVFVPAFAIANSGLLPNLLASIAGVAIVVTGAIYFADREMKMPGNYFRGFPAIWNTAAFYLLLLRPSPVWSTVAVPIHSSTTGRAIASPDGCFARPMGRARAHHSRARHGARALDHRRTLRDCDLRGRAWSTAASELTREIKSDEELQPEAFERRARPETTIRERRARRRL
jgi:phosphatidylcholine synthase